MCLLVCSEDGLALDGRLVWYVLAEVTFHCPPTKKKSNIIMTSLSAALFQYNVYFSWVGWVQKLFFPSVPRKQTKYRKYSSDTDNENNVIFLRSLVKFLKLSRLLILFKMEGKSFLYRPHVKQ